MPLAAINVALADRSYQIHFGSARGDDFAALLARLTAGRPVMSVTDRNVAKQYALLVYRHGHSCVLPPGEANKNLSAIETIGQAAAEADLDRKSVFIAYGGGVIGDMTGFAAAVYMRGVDFIQVPTSLLAMVDASIGGKTGVDIAAGKNLIGAFHQPLAVWIDVDFLASLPEREFANGMAEIIKVAVALDREFWDYLEQNRVALKAKDKTVLSYAIGRACELKAQIVAADEKESGVRALLNYGHTFGHAIENLTGYQTPHGTAVAMGMHAAGLLAMAQNQWTAAEQKRQDDLLQFFDLDILTPADLPVAGLIAAMRHDKKASHGEINVVLPQSGGRAQVVKNIAEKDLQSVWSQAK